VTGFPHFLTRLTPNTLDTFSGFNSWVNSFMQSLLQQVSFYLCLRPMNN